MSHHGDSALVLYEVTVLRLVNVCYGLVNTRYGLEQHVLRNCTTCVRPVCLQVSHVSFPGMSHFQLLSNVRRFPLVPPLCIPFCPTSETFRCLWYSWVFTSRVKFLSLSTSVTTPSVPQLYFRLSTLPQYHNSTSYLNYLNSTSMSTPLQYVNSTQCPLTSSLPYCFHPSSTCLHAPQPFYYLPSFSWPGPSSRSPREKAEGPATQTRLPACRSICEARLFCP